MDRSAAAKLSSSASKSESFGLLYVIFLVFLASSSNPLLQTFLLVPRHYSKDIDLPCNIDLPDHLVNPSFVHQ